MITLGIESSCDETSVAIVRDGREVLSNIIASQIDVHKKYGGVVPEIASRKHVEAISQVIDEAFKEAEISYDDLDMICATRGPGLIGALLVGLSAGRTMAYALDKPFVGVNHMMGHICANYISNKELEPPFICLVVSGGHTYLLDVKDYTEFKLIGRTLDDAAGEAYDKISRVLGLGYPGGPEIEKAARDGEDIYNYPRVMINDGYDFSFSGLKTAVINHLHNMEQKNESYRIEDVARSFQDAVIDVLVEKTIRLTEERNLDKIVLSGGVSANGELRRRMEEASNEHGYRVYYPEKILCTDNAAMIASAGYYEYKSGKYENNVTAKPNLGLENSWQNEDF